MKRFLVVFMAVISLQLANVAQAQPPTLGGGVSKPKLARAASGFNERARSSLMYISHTENMPYGFSIFGTNPGGAGFYWDVKFSPFSDVFRSQDYTLQEYISDGPSGYFPYETVKGYFNTNYGITIVVWDYIALYGGLGATLINETWRYSDVNEDYIYIRDEDESNPTVKFSYGYGLAGMYHPDFMSVGIIGRIGYEANPNSMCLGIGFAF